MYHSGQTFDTEHHTAAVVTIVVSSTNVSSSEVLGIVCATTEIPRLSRRLHRRSTSMTWCLGQQGRMNMKDTKMLREIGEFLTS